jgi:hypothetical protein
MILTINICSVSDSKEFIMDIRLLRRKQMSRKKRKCTMDVDFFRHGTGRGMLISGNHKNSIKGESA